MHIAVNPSTLPARPGGWLSRAVRVESGGALLLVSGQVATGDDGAVARPGDMERQAARVFELIGRVLADQGASFDDVVGIRTYTTDMADIAAYGRARARSITGTPPTSTTVEASRLLAPDALVEVEVTAAVEGRA